MNHGTSVLGLGGMGTDMIVRMAAYPGFDVVCIWDPDEAARALTHRRFPDLAVADSLEEAVQFDGSSVVYIASPPDTHASLATASIEAGKAVYCEKPLGVDLDSSRQLVELAEVTKTANVVNFSMASTAATRAAETWIETMGDQIISIEVRVRFSQWPRRWQMGAATWLAKRQQGGFVREVVSHWVYLTERLFGPTQVDDSRVVYPGDENAETVLNADLRSNGTPISVSGVIGGVGPDTVEYTMWGSEESARISSWHRFDVSSGGPWAPDDATTKTPGEVNNRMQLANAAAAFAGEPHSMPGFKDAFSVQKVIEQLLTT